MELLRVMEYMNGNKANLPEVVELYMKVFKFVSELDVLNNNMLENTLKKNT